MTDDKMPVDLDKLFALLGRGEFALHVTAHALARSEKIRARLEEGAEFQNAERNRLIEKTEDLRARLQAVERERDAAVVENEKMALTLKLWGEESARQEKEIGASDATDTEPTQ